MVVESILYTGWLTFRDECFEFALNGSELHLIPAKNKKEELKWKWIREQIAPGTWTPKIEAISERIIIGECAETDSKIVFIPIRNSYINSNNCALIIELWGYILYKCGMDKPIDRISFSCPELDHIYSINRFTKHKFNDEKRVFSVQTIEMEKMKSAPQTFMADGTDCQIFFGTSVKSSRKPEETPLQIQACMVIGFDPTEEYERIIKLWNIGVSFIEYMSYRKNIGIMTATLYSLYQDGSQEACAELVQYKEDYKSEQYPLKKDRFIHQENIAGAEGKILEAISEGNLYTRHIPESYASGRSITAARFVMITAALEWEFSRLYPDGVKKTEKTIKAENEVIEKINPLIDNSTGETKEILQKIRTYLEEEKGNSLIVKIKQIGKDFSGMTEIFGNDLYHRNGSKLKISSMASRLSEQRNHFAHGDLDKEFIGDSLLDLIYLEWLIYAIQLRRCGVSDQNIYRAINSLFAQNKRLE